MENCIFCKIAKGEIPCYKVWEDEKHLAFLDISPVVKGQVLVIPKKHVGGYLFDLEESDYQSLLNASKKVAKLIDSSLNPIKTGVIVEGFEVDHVHIKLYPLTKPFELKGSVDLTEEEFKDLQKKISGSI